MWNVVAAPYLAGCALLVAAGLPKLRDPAPLVRALRSVDLPAGRRPVRLLAGVEVLLGVAGAVAPGRTTGGLVSLAYLLFTGFVALALHRGGVLASCGCFGKPDTPPTRVHLAVTGLLALSAAGVAAVPPPRAWHGGPVSPAVVLTGYAAVLAFLAYLTIAVLPTVSPAAVRGTPKG